MSAIENQLRKAINQQGAQDSEGRLQIYRSAQKIINKYPIEQRAQISDKLTAAISNIEDEFQFMHEPLQVDKSVSIFTMMKLFLEIKVFFKALIIAFLLVGFGFLSFQYAGNDQTEKPRAQKTTIANNDRIQSVFSYEFPRDQNLFLIQLIKEEEIESDQSNDDVLSISKDTNLLSNDSIIIDRENIYLAQLKIKLPQDISAETQLPTLYAGFYNYGIDDKLLDEPLQALYIIHSSQLKLANLTVPQNGVISLSGIISGTGGIDDEGFPDTAHAFRLFIGIIMDKSSTPIELISLSVSSLK